MLLSARHSTTRRCRDDSHKQTTHPGITRCYRTAIRLLIFTAPVFVVADESNQGFDLASATAVSGLSVSVLQPCIAQPIAIFHHAVRSCCRECGHRAMHALCNLR